MRQLFTVRFVAVVAALAGLALFVDAVFMDDDPLEAVLERSQAEHRIDLIAPILFTETSDDFDIRRDGRTTGIIDFVLDDRRVVRVTADTPSDVECDGLTGIDQCAIFVDLLGEAVVWFGVRPQNEQGDVELPPIVELEDGFAIFENGWQVRFPPVIERICEGEDIVNFSDFLRRFGPDSVSVVDLEEQLVTQVRCAGNAAEDTAPTTTEAPTLPVDGVPSGAPSSLPEDESFDE